MFYYETINPIKNWRVFVIKSMIKDIILDTWLNLIHSLTILKTSSNTNTKDFQFLFGEQIMYPKQIGNLGSAIKYLFLVNSPVKLIFLIHMWSVDFIKVVYHTFLGIVIRILRPCQYMLFPKINIFIRQHEERFECLF